MNRLIQDRLLMANTLSPKLVCKVLYQKEIFLLSAIEDNGSRPEIEAQSNLHLRLPLISDTFPIEETFSIHFRKRLRPLLQMTI